MLIDVRNGLDSILTEVLNDEADKKVYHDYVFNTGTGNREGNIKNNNLLPLLFCYCLLPIL